MRLAPSASTHAQSLCSGGRPKPTPRLNARRGYFATQQKVSPVNAALPVFMFLALAILLFSGFPVAFILGGVGLMFGFIGIFFEVFSFIEFFNILSRIWGGVCENLILVAIPMFIFMGYELSESKIADDLYRMFHVWMGGLRGGLAKRFLKRIPNLPTFAVIRNRLDRPRQRTRSQPEFDLEYFSIKTP